jgi:hypothetical protein
MDSEGKETHVSSNSPVDSEKGTGRRASVEQRIDAGAVSANLREEDFLTRNGLNFKSFQRRKLRA